MQTRELAALSCLIGLSVHLNLADAAEPASGAQWEPAIKAFEQADKKATPPPEGVLFVGSSSIRLWNTLTNDFSDLPVIQRGFGGSQMSDLLAYADRIVLPYRPKVVVIYEGDNDLASGRTPEDVLQDYRQLVERIRAKLPQTQLIFIAVKPSPSRWHLAEKVRRTNFLIEDFSKKQQRLDFADIFVPMLNDQGEPRPELFVEDRLHLNAEGYKLWTGVLRPIITRGAAPKDK